MAGDGPLAISLTKRNAKTKIISFTSIFGQVSFRMLWFRIHRLEKYLLTKHIFGTCFVNFLCLSDSDAYWKEKNNLLIKALLDQLLLCMTQGNFLIKRLLKLAVIYILNIVTVTKIGRNQSLYICFLK